jgi:hypothetical protein
MVIPFPRFQASVWQRTPSKLRFMMSEFVPHLEKDTKRGRVHLKVVRVRKWTCPLSSLPFFTH